MSYKICLEQSHTLHTLSKSKRNDLAVIDTDNISMAVIKTACARGMWVYGYVNAGAL